MKMEMKIKKKDYIYDSETQEVFTKEGELAKDQDMLLRVIYNFIASVRIRGFDFNMNFNQFDAYVKVLECFEKDELFHKIYDTYLYIGEYMNNDKQVISQSEFSKCMSRLKRYEVYLYKITSS